LNNDVKAVAGMVPVRLEWDSETAGAFDQLLPSCAVAGNTVKIIGIRDEVGTALLAKRIQGCRSEYYRDRTGVRFRLNRARGICVPPEP